MTRLIGLYPRLWRDRYEIEFRALMAERPPDQLDRIDIVRGALDARLHPQLAPTPPGEAAPSRSARPGGVLAVVGGVLWAVAGIAFNNTLVNPSLGYKESESAGAIAIAAAIVTGLAASAASRSLPGRPGHLSIAPIVVLVGGLAMLFPWPIVALGFVTTIFGTVLFGLVTFGLLGTARFGPTGILLAGAGLLASMFNTEDARALFLLPLGGAWILLGIVLAIRGTPAMVDSMRDLG